MRCLYVNCGDCVPQIGQHTHTEKESEAIGGREAHTSLWPRARGRAMPGGRPAGSKDKKQRSDGRWKSQRASQPSGRSSRSSPHRQTRFPSWQTGAGSSADSSRAGADHGSAVDGGSARTTSASEATQDTTAEQPKRPRATDSDASRHSSDREGTCRCCACSCTVAASGSARRRPLFLCTRVPFMSRPNRPTHRATRAQRTPPTLTRVDSPPWTRPGITSLPTHVSLNGIVPRARRCGL